MSILIISRNNRAAPESARRLAEHLSTTLATRVSSITVDVRSDDSGAEKWKFARDGFLAAFNQVCQEIDERLLSDREFARRRIVLIQDDVHAEPGQAFVETLVATNFTTWRNLSALLVVTYPDLLWAFGVSNKNRDDLAAQGLGLHAVTNDSLEQSLQNLLYARDIGFDPLFDPSGLRSQVKERSFKSIGHLFRKRDGELECARRSQLAVVIDDEEEVAEAIAYVHYKRGYRVQTITNQALIAWNPDFGTPVRSAESFTIAFPDANGAAYFPPPEARAAHVSFLTKIPAERRIVFTIDEHAAAKGKGNLSLWPYSIQNAPFAGFGGLQRCLGLDTAPSGFYWPPSHPEGGHRRGRHAVPGFIAHAARHLLDRLRKSSDLSPAVQSILALEAQELLLNRLPSLSLVAQQERIASEIRLQMQLPTIFGRSDSGDPSDVDARFCEIEAECTSILSVVFSESTQRKKRLSRLFQSQLIGVMIDEFRRSYHFHEEIRCISKQRSLDLGRNPFGWYMAQILSTPVRFVAAVAGWALVFGVAYLVIDLANGQFNAARPFAVSVYTLASVGAVPDAMAPTYSSPFGQLCYQWTVIFECLFGLFHWGTGLAHLYTLLSRR